MAARQRVNLHPVTAELTEPVQHLTRYLAKSRSLPLAMSYQAERQVFVAELEAEQHEALLIVHYLRQGFPDLVVTLEAEP